MSNPFADVERLAIHTSDGLALRAELLGADAADESGDGSGRPPRAVAVLCHPHPLHGGNMHNHVVSGLFTALPAVGVPTIRFNFRGTSGSEGRHGGGVPERLDVAAAIEAITTRYTGTDGAPPPLLLVGYSFGALVALSVDHPAISGRMAIAPPLTRSRLDDAGTEPVAATDARPTVILAGTVDDFAPADDVSALTDGWTATTVVALPGEDHFLSGASARMRAEAERFLEDLVGG